MLISLIKRIQHSAQVLCVDLYTETVPIVVEGRFKLVSVVEPRHKSNVTAVGSYMKLVTAQRMVKHVINVKS